MLNASSGLLQDEPLDAFFDNGSHITFLIPLTINSNFFPISTRPLTSKSTIFSSFIFTGPSTEDPSTSNLSIEVNQISHVYFQSRWDSMTIEVVGSDVRDVFSGWKTRSQKKHASVVFMTCVPKNFDLVTYLDVEGWPQVVFFGLGCV